jgi:hypothetical protein
MRHVSTILLILLTLTHNVHAECAWVLWGKFEVHKLNVKGNKPEDQWEARSAYPVSSSGLLLCIQVMKQSVDDTRKTWEEGWGKDNVFYSAAGVSGREESVSVITSNEFKSYSYRCLPDTIKNPEASKTPAK